MKETKTKSRREKREEKKRRHRKRNAGVLASLILITFAFYAVLTLVNQQTQIAEKQAELEELEDAILVQEVMNEEIEEVYELDDDENDEYIERVAREEFDYSMQGERVFVNVAGE